MKRFEPGERHRTAHLDRGVILDRANNRETQYVSSTGVEVDGLHQVVPVCVSVSEMPGQPVVVMFMAISDEPVRRDHEIERAVLGEGGGFEVVASGTPGVWWKEWREKSLRPDQTHRQNQKQQEALRRGSFRGLGEAAARAVARSLEQSGLKERDIVVLGQSLGASMAFASIDEMLKQGLKVTDLVSMDAVGFAPANPVQRIQQFVKAGMHAGPYIKSNHELLQENLESFPTWIRRAILSDSLKANLAITRAISMGRMAYDLTGEEGNKIDRGRVDRLQGVNFHLYAANESEYGTQKPTEEVKKKLASFGIKANFAPLDGHHAIIMSSEAIVDCLRGTVAWAKSQRS